MNFKLWLESVQSFYHATDDAGAKNIMTKGWSVAIPRRLDAGDLGWGIYFYKSPTLKGTYGNIVISANIQMDDVIDIHNEADPRVQLWMKLFFYTPKHSPIQKTRTIDPYADVLHDRRQFRDRAIQMLKDKGKSFGDAMDKVVSYMKPHDDSWNEENSKVIRRQMLKVGVKGVLSGKELVVYDPSIIIDQTQL